MKHFNLLVKKHQGISLGILEFDLQGEKVNKFNREVMGEFEELLKLLQGKKSEFEALVLVSKKPGIFIAGADIQLIQATRTESEATELAHQGQIMLNHWEDLPFPKIAAINGACMGGGCELSLASTAIVMSNDPSARIGLPETLLGVIPGMGGCIRMPWKIGIAQAFDLILSGKTLVGEKAAKLGLADACLPKENFEENVLNWTVKNLNKLKSGERIAKEPKLGGMGGLAGKLLESTPMGRAVIYKKAREGVLSKTKGQYPSPLEAIKVIEETKTGYQACFKGKTRDQALAREAQGFGKMAATPISKNLIRLFFMTEAVKKSNGLSSGSSGVKTAKITQAGVLGAGVMGGGIAHLLADKGVNVLMKDIAKAGLEIGIQSALKLFKKSLKRRSINERQMMQKLNRITPTISYDGFQSAELVVEAIIEKMEIKQATLKEIENYVSPSCVIATNTSSLSVSTMQSVMKNPERFAGMHFFNPVHKMPLVEVIRGEKSSDQAVSQVYQFAKQIGKTPIVVKDAPGFLVNRLLMPYLTEAGHLLMAGAPLDELDQALLKFGMPMGPVELMDEVGLDVADKVAHILYDAFGDRMSPPNTFSKLLELKRLGKKSKAGFYLYEGDGDRLKKQMDSQIYSLVGVEPKPGAFSADEMVERCVFSMVNEAARCLEEKIVETAAEVDLGMIMGTGFPPFRGGLLKYADAYGLDKIIEKLKQFEAKYGKRFTPAPYLVQLAGQGKSFSENI